MFGWMGIFARMVAETVGLQRPVSRSKELKMVPRRCGNIGISLLDFCVLAGYFVIKGVVALGGLKNRAVLSLSIRGQLVDRTTDSLILSHVLYLFPHSLSRPCS